MAPGVVILLPLIRTAVDHGTAYDIAGTGKADERNLVKAIEMTPAMASRG
jgi:4-hydroxythreonine-4-phosphate dehydrogenase